MEMFKYGNSASTRNEQEGLHATFVHLKWEQYTFSENKFFKSGLHFQFYFFGQGPTAICKRFVLSQNNARLWAHLRFNSKTWSHLFTCLDAQAIDTLTNIIFSLPTFVIRNVASKIVWIESIRSNWNETLARENVSGYHTRQRCLF